jgi:hypothetical protein
MDTTTLSGLGAANSKNTLTNYLPNCYPLFTPLQLQTLLLCNPNAASPGPAPLLSPCMTAVLSSTTPSGSSYYGSLNFLDSQSAFDLSFPHPIPLRVVTLSTATLSIDSLLLQKSITAFVDQCKFRIFVPIFCSDYVGTTNRNDAASLNATNKALKQLFTSSCNPSNGQWLNLTPNELYAKYSTLTPLLPVRVSLWGMNLVTQFHDALSPDLQELLLADPSYSAPNLSTLTSCSTQLAALSSLRFSTVRHHTLMRAQETLVTRTVSRKLKHAPTTIAAPFSAAVTSLVCPATSIPASTIASDNVSAIAKVFLSPAEQTMQRYQPTPVNGPPSFPIDPATNF